MQELERVKVTQAGRIGLSGLLGGLLTIHHPSINAHMSAREVTMLVTLSVVWGGSFFFIAVAIEDLPPFTIVALRVVIAAIMLWGIVWLLGKRPPASWRVWLSLLGMGVINNVIPFTMIVWGQTHIASAGATNLLLVTFLVPVSAILLGTLVLGERLETLHLLGMALIGLGLCAIHGRWWPTRKARVGPITPGCKGHG